MVEILIVDDVAENRANYSKVAEDKRTDRNIENAGDVLSALAWIEKRHFDLVVSDLNMDGDDMAGLKVLEAAKAADPNVQVIVVTAFGSPNSSRSVMEAGAFDYLSRTAADVDFWVMLKHKIRLALEFRQALSND